MDANERIEPSSLCSCWWGFAGFFSGPRYEYGSIPEGLPIAICRAGTLKGRLTILIAVKLWWQGWAPAQQGHGTICISCHTVVPYAMARPALRQAADETAMSAPEKVLINSVEKRVGNWTQMAPFYSREAEIKQRSLAQRRQ